MNLKLKKIFFIPFKFSEREKCSEKGFSLVEVLMSMALLGVIASSASLQVSQQYKMSEKTIEQGEKEDIRNMIRMNTSCEKGCAASLETIPKVIGKWSIRGSCKDLGMYFEIKRKADSENLLKNKGWKPLFKTNNGIICQRFSSEIYVQQDRNPEEYRDRVKSITRSYLKEIKNAYDEALLHDQKIAH